MLYCMVVGLPVRAIAGLPLCIGGWLCSFQLSCLGERDPAGPDLLSVDVLCHVADASTGKAVQGALVSLRSRSPDEFHFEVTGAEGRWTCRHLPGQLRDLSLHVLHSDFAAATFKMNRGNVDGNRQLSAEQLRDGTAVMFVQRGVTAAGLVLPLSADGREQAVKLRQILAVTGRVVDSATGQLLGDFQVIPGHVHGDQQHWDRGLARPGSGGQFSIPLPGVRHPRVIKIEADGYYPELSRHFREHEEDAVMNFSLQKGKKLTGVVINANRFIE